MADIYSQEKRSEIMSRIRSTGTVAEQRLYELLRQVVGKRVKIVQYENGLPAKPDFFIPRYKVTIFMDGCFFHYCPLHGHIPKSNTEYWETKIKRNVRRDRRERTKLRNMGYSVWRFWEHDLKPTTLIRTRRILQGRIERIKSASTLHNVPDITK